MLNWLSDTTLWLGIKILPQKYNQNQYIRQLFGFNFHFIYSIQKLSKLLQNYKDTTAWKKTAFLHFIYMDWFEDKLHCLWVYYFHFSLMWDMFASRGYKLTESLSSGSQQGQAQRSPHSWSTLIYVTRFSSKRSILFYWKPKFSVHFSTKFFQFGICGFFLFPNIGQKSSSSAL